MPAEAKEQRKTYKQKLKEGCCPRCGAKKKKRETTKYCGNCLEYFRNYGSINSELQNEKRRALYNERVENRLCTRCGVKLPKKHTKKRCDKCSKK